MNVFYEKFPRNRSFQMNTIVYAECLQESVAK